MNDGQSKFVRGEVSLTYVAKQEGSKWILDVDLDSVYNAVEDTKLKEVYALCPSNIEVTNKFQLVTELYLRRENEFGEETDRLIGKKESKPFLLRTEPRTHRASASSGTPGKRFILSLRDCIMLCKSSLDVCFTPTNK